MLFKKRFESESSTLATVAAYRNTMALSIQLTYYYLMLFVIVTSLFKLVWAGNSLPSLKGVHLRVPAFHVICYIFNYILLKPMIDISFWLLFGNEVSAVLLPAKDERTQLELVQWIQHGRHQLLGRRL